MKNRIEKTLEELVFKMNFIEKSDRMFCINIDWIVLNAKRQALTELLKYCK